MTRNTEGEDAVITNQQIVQNALKLGLVVPSFNVPYLPMVEPVIRAAVDTDSFALIATARLEWYKFEGQGLGPVFDAYKACEHPGYTRLHLDHVPVVDEDDVTVDYLGILKDAATMGYDSLMVDGSRLRFDENVAATRAAVELAHEAGLPCEAELGAVFGHEAGPPPPYEELFASGKGFTDVDEAAEFVKQTGCDWLSVAVGSVHGAISGALRHQKKVEARLNIEHLEKLRDATGVPLVLHGGSGVKQEYILQGMKSGIAKINIGTEVRQVYEQSMRDSDDVPKAQQAVYDKIVWMLNEYFQIAGTKAKVDEAWGTMK